MDETPVIITTGTQFLRDLKREEISEKSLDFGKALILQHWVAHAPPCSQYDAAAERPNLQPFEENLSYFP